jgi:hypothetical protein
MASDGLESRNKGNKGSRPWPFSRDIRKYRKKSERVVPQSQSITFGRKSLVSKNFSQAVKSSTCRSGVLCTCKFTKPNRNIDASAATENCGAGICQLHITKKGIARKTNTKFKIFSRLPFKIVAHY